MIDWVTFCVPYKGQNINGGRIVSMDQNGNVQYLLDKFLDVEGSHSTNVRMKGYNGKLYVSGNPAKYLQGHNLFGTDDLIPLLLKYWDDLSKKIPFDLDADFTRQFIALGYIDVNRLDINRSYSLDSSYDAKAWLRAAFQFMNQGRQEVKEDYGTIYIGKNSSRISVKLYFKGEEFQKNTKGFVHSPDVHRSLCNWSNNKIRMEVTLRKKHLSENIFCHKFIKLHSKLGKSLKCKRKPLNYGYLWTPELVNQVFDYVVSEKVKLPEDSNVLKSDYRFKLPKEVQRSYLLFMKGEDPAAYMSRAQFYRHRKHIKDVMGLDIKRPKGEVLSDFNNVVPLIRVLEATPAQIPDWAYEYNLVAINS